MKTPKLFTVVLIIIISFAGINNTADAALADSNTIKEVRTWGIGLRVVNFTPTSIISLVITPHKNFRIEPEVGYSRGKSYSSGLSEYLSDRSIYLGLGMYGMINRGSVKVYFGLRGAMVNSTSEFPNYNSGGAYTKDEMQSNQLLFGAVVGSEYLFSRHFGIGGEIGVKQSNYHGDVNNAYDNSSHDHKQDKSFQFLTESGLFLRFYF